MIHPCRRRQRLRVACHRGKRAGTPLWPLVCGMGRGVRHDDLADQLLISLLLIEKDKLLVGQNDEMLIINMKSKEIISFANFEQGSNIDGIEPDGEGNYLVTDYFGKLYKVTAKGEKTLLLNTTTPGIQLADFCYIPSKKLIVIPTFGENSVRGFLLHNK